ncbi:serine O-acetyltransferase [Pseudanabaena galeata UHCC 0370]|uniref:Serine acetyltransferase n=1 Tax=Pseudanabaena galeata UHCC 0370 TaxID=3110310 RepID=A0ABU5TIN0_9CYAN|nr:serine O-acetyltransferase [Pseudanabaena galeata]MEA5478180.1 serine O-acetyltransferase [Pseudanabaena galeata UHCC 0370]
MLQPISHLDTLDTQEIDRIYATAYPSDFPAKSSAHSLWQFYQLQLAQLPLAKLQVDQKWQQVTEVLQVFKADFQAITDRDPAAHHWLEILCCYPGLHALVIHRFTHWLHHRQIPILPRLIAYCARFITGLDIHPAATIGKGVFIDHGMGVVIGETAIVGDYVLLYQGVTFGGTGKETGKRHPTIGNHAIVGAGAKVLGNIHIGDYARIGAGSVVLRDVPPHTTAVGVPARVCRINQPASLGQANQEQLADPSADMLQALLLRIERLEQQLSDKISQK